MSSRKTQCDRCGTCCQQGGPALHTKDLPLVRNGVYGFEDLVTVRRGELAIAPLASEAEPVAEEFLKVQGNPGSWSCKFYDSQRSRCSMYTQRPLACRVLECSAPEALLTIAGKQLITRFDCIDQEDPLLPLIREHEQNCPCPDLHAIGKELAGQGDHRELLRSLAHAVNLDLRYRTAATRSYALPVTRELFYFGRPLFQLLVPLGVRSTQEDGELVLSLCRDR